MDISSFNGGNVNQWQAFWPNTAASSFFWNKALNRAQGCTKMHCPWTQYLPIEGKFSATYAQSGHILVDQLGKESLWREWYLLPGAHIWQWPEFPSLGLSQPQIYMCRASGCPTSSKPWEELLALYKEMATTVAPDFECKSPPLPPSGLSSGALVAIIVASSVVGVILVAGLAFLGHKACTAKQQDANREEVQAHAVVVEK
mmetsp:Transcript_12272/g.31365  ORF Transcript_12272/g.31365 Transcript_12272/m.31365 type:complete len:201 (+) Transcript_12272:2873-3475(+)